MSPLSMAGLQDLELAFAQHLRVVVGRRAAEQEVVALRLRVVDALRLHFADLLVVERDIGIDIGIENQTVIRHDLDARLLRFGDHIAERLRIERHDHDHVDAARDQVFDLRNLPLFARIGGLHRYFRAELFRCSDEIVAIARPALDAQIVDTEADFRMILACMRERRGIATGWRAPLHTRANSDGTTRCEFHVSLHFLIAGIPDWTVCAASHKPDKRQPKASRIRAVNVAARSVMSCGALFAFFYCALLTAF